MSNYPGTIDAFNVIGTTNYMDEAGYVLHEHLNTEGSAINKIETTLGTTGGTSVLKNFTAGDFSARISSSNVLQQVLTGTINSSILGTPTITGGNVNSATMGTPNMTGGTASQLTLSGTPVLTTPIVKTAYQNGNVTGNGTINWANGDLQAGTLTGNGTLDFSNAVAGQRLTLFLNQDGTGGRTIAFTPTVTWQDNITPTWGTTASKPNAMVVYAHDGTTYFGMGAKFASS